MVAAAVIGGAVIGAGASYAAADKQSKAANSATNLQGQINQENQAHLAPYMAAGTPALSKLSDLLGTSGNTSAAGYGSLTQPFTMNDYLANQDPGYQFQLQQGQQALQASQAAQNGVLSGSAMKDLIAYDQNYAATGFQNAFNRFQTTQGNTYQRLSGLAGLGENAAAGAGNLGVQSGANMANTIVGAGNASAAGTIGAANSISNGANNLAGYYYMNNMLTQRNTMPVNSSDPYGYASGQDAIAPYANSPS